MKKTNRSSHDELNLTNYSAMKNILYCLNNTVKCHSPLLCLCSFKNTDWHVNSNFNNHSAQNSNRDDYCKTKRI